MASAAILLPADGGPNADPAGLLISRYSHLSLHCQSLRVFGSHHSHHVTQASLQDQINAAEAGHYPCENCSELLKQAQVSGPRVFSFNPVLLAGRARPDTSFSTVTSPGLMPERAPTHSANSTLGRRSSVNFNFLVFVL